MKLTNIRLLPLIIAALVLMVVMNQIGAPLTTPAAKLGIISFELARTPAASGAILTSWEAVPAAPAHAGFSLGLDYLFMLVYALAFAIACLKTGEVLRRHGWPLAGLARPLAGAAAAAALLDAAENIALTVILFGGQAVSPWPFVAWLCAVIKFGLLFVCLVYAFYGAAIRLMTRLLPEQRQTAR